MYFFVELAPPAYNQSPNPIDEYSDKNGTQYKWYPNGPSPSMQYCRPYVSQNLGKDSRARPTIIDNSGKVENLTLFWL